VNEENFVASFWNPMAIFYASIRLSNKMTTPTRLLQWKHDLIEYQPGVDRIHLIRWDKGSTLRLVGNMWAEQKDGIEGRLVHSYVKRQVREESDSDSDD
jgi:hypothetical protein